MTEGPLGNVWESFWTDSPSSSPVVTEKQAQISVISQVDSGLLFPSPIYLSFHTDREILKVKHP